MDINEIVKKQIEILLSLDSLLDVEKDVLIKDKASELPKIIEEKKEIARKIVEIEKIRISIYKEKTAEELVTEGILDKDKVDKLKSIVKSIKEKEETNMVLTKQSLNYIKMITSALNPNKNVITYGNSGKIENGKVVNVFTTKV
ncbi:flagellar protein FlgN [Caloramator sp. E03]|uniref:flagellar protein FlgN n=1 Tax=Caloramator sp. E03 TaxID=2576307 RepID=UPI0011109E66|nr:flagellar protein FlgN [Caloramator sp. E03]QCX32376.1 flagellar protein FlgN [Caloramator sp. E03]